MAATAGRTKNVILLFFSSLSLGWMIGMSVSPVVNTVVASVIAVLVTAVSLLSGFKLDETAVQKIPRSITDMSIVPVAILTIGLAIGSAMGIFTRTHNFLGVVDHHINSITTKKQTDDDGKSTTAGLFEVSVEDCGIIELKHGRELRAALLSIGDKNIHTIVLSCNSDSCLEAIKEVVCSASK